MALNKTQLKQALLNAFNAVSNIEGDPADFRQQLATELSNAIDAFVKSATVTVNAGIAVSTTGTAAAQTGTTTSTGTGTIS